MSGYLSPLSNLLREAAAPSLAFTSIGMRELASLTKKSI